MYFIEKAKCWFNKKKKYILIGGTFVVCFAGAGITYVICNKNKMSFSDWLKVASNEELETLHENEKLNFFKTGVKSFIMQKISEELGNREGQQWIAKHPPNSDPNYRWTDKNRWDKD